MSGVLLGLALVTIVIDGRLVQGSLAASLRDGVVVAPLDPYVRAIADRIDADPAGERYVLTRGERRVIACAGSRRARGDRRDEAFPIAPYVRAGEMIIPLAAVARALGASVTYDARSRTLAILTPPAAPLARFTPETPVRDLTSDRPTFPPTSAPVPAVVVTGVPRPRRTPIVLAPPRR